MKGENSVRVGRTIAGEWERQESESERLAARKKGKIKKIVKVLSFVALLGVISVVAIIKVTVWTDNRKKEEIEKAGCKLVYQPPYSPDFESNRTFLGSSKEKNRCASAKF